MLSNLTERGAPVETAVDARPAITIQGNTQLPIKNRVRHERALVGLVVAVDRDFAGNVIRHASDSWKPAVGAVSGVLVALAPRVVARQNAVNFGLVRHDVDGLNRVLVDVGVESGPRAAADNEEENRQSQRDRKEDEARRARRDEKQPARDDPDTSQKPAKRLRTSRLLVSRVGCENGVSLQICRDVPIRAVPTSTGEEFFLVCARRTDSHKGDEDLAVVCA